MVSCRIHSLRILLFLSLFISASCSKDDDPKVEKDEGLYINELYASSGEDWIELYNSSDAAKDIGGYRIYDDEANKYTLPASTMIAGKGFIILICDDTGTGLHTNFRLSSSGETISLENKAGELIDLVQFPILEDGESYGRFPDGSDVFGISGISTKGASNGDIQAALIQSVTRTPLVPGLTDPVVVKADVLSNSGISSVKLFYRIGTGAFSSVDMVGTGTSYQATIPALNGVGEVFYYIEARNTAGLVTTDPYDAPSDLHSYLLNTDALPDLRINEFMASNISCCPDQDGTEDEFDDWIEIYNAGSVPVNIAGMYISDDKGDPFKNRIPSTNAALTTIAPGGFLIIWADENGSQGELHANFQLAKDGEDVALFYIDGRTIDFYSYGVQQDDKSSGLSVDGGNTWQVLSSPTPGLSNE